MGKRYVVKTLLAFAMVSPDNSCDVVMRMGMSMIRKFFIWPWSLSECLSCCSQLLICAPLMTLVNGIISSNECGGCWIHHVWMSKGMVPGKNYSKHQDVLFHPFLQYKAFCRDDFANSWIIWLVQSKYGKPPVNSMLA